MGNDTRVLADCFGSLPVSGIPTTANREEGSANPFLLERKVTAGFRKGFLQNRFSWSVLYCFLLLYPQSQPTVFCP